MIARHGRHVLFVVPLLLVLAGGGWSAQPPSETAAGWLSRVDSLRIASLADSALEVISQAIPMAEAAADSSFLLGLWVRQGELLTSLGFARDGEAVLRRAREWSLALGDSVKYCVAIRWLSVAVGSQGRADESADLCRTLLAVAETRGDRAHVAWACVGLAWQAETRGEMTDALDLYGRAAALFREVGNARGEAWARNGLGNAQSGLGRYDEARESYRTAENLARGANYRMVQGLAANNLGTLEYSLGDPGEAVRHFRKALLIRREIGNLREAIVPGINLALCDAELGRLDDSSDSLEALLATCRSGGYSDLSAKVLNQLAATRDLQGRKREARSLYRASLAIGSQAPMKNRVEATLGLAKSLAEADSVNEALGLLRRTLESLDGPTNPTWRMEIEAHIGEILLDERDPSAALPHLHRALATARSLHLPAAHEQALIDIGLAWRDLERPDSAAAAWEEAAELWAEVRGAPVDPEWREARGLVGRSLATDATALLIASRPGPVGVRQAYDFAQRFKTRTLIERMEGPASHASDLRATITLDRLQSEILEDGELLLDYFLGPRVSYLFAVSRGTCRVVALPTERALIPMATLYHDLLRTPPASKDAEAAIREAGESLHGTLFVGMDEPLRTARRVLVSPDGVLNTIPFELVDEPDPDLREWIRIPSAAVLALLRSREQGRSAGPQRILALAGVRGPSGDLPGVREEVERLVRRYRGTEARYFTPADTLRLEDLTEAPEVLHVASHSRADDQRPWLSRIDLGGTGLRADRIASSKIPVRLAVLSSCQTQHGKVLSGEGTLGLSTALLCAGSECVVATLWPVDDRTTARLMGRFYEELASGRTVARAIRSAQRSVRDRPSTSHPFYWAGFVAIGRGDLVVPLHVNGIQRKLAAGIACGVILLAGCILLARREKRGSSVTADPEKRLMG